MSRFALLPLFALPLMSVPALSHGDTVRQMGAHEHGSGTFNIAFDGSQVMMELRAPGADIVGFEYAAKSAEDRAAIEAALGTLATPTRLFVLPEAAACTVTSASAELEIEGADHDHDHEAAHDHDDDHDHADGTSHSEFHADYTLTCADPSAITGIEFAYFATFPNARELDIQMISDAGTQGFEVTRDAPALDLRGLL